MIGKRLKQLRTEEGLSQQTLSEKLSVSKDSISQYERDIITPNDEVKIEIAKYFNVSVDYLIGAINTLEPLERICITLPRNFKPEWAKELEEDAEYIVYKNSFSLDEKKLISKWSNMRKDKQEALIKLMQED